MESVFAADRVRKRFTSLGDHLKMPAKSSRA
jgi:hypothetical protein